MPSDLPTTFSPGLLFLEALDYAGYSAKCNLTELFDLLVTSSDFMNSAILPQLIMKRNFTLFASDLKTSIPYEFCHSLRYVRELRVGFYKDNEEPDEDSSNKKSDERIAQDQIDESHALATLLENSGLFGYYLRKLTVCFEKEKNEAALLLLRNSLCFVNKLETLVLEMPLSDPNSSQALSAATSSLGKHLTTLELELALSLPHVSSDFLEPLISCDRLKSLTIKVTALYGPEGSAMRYDGLDFSWLTTDCSLCDSLKTLKLENMCDHVAGFRPFSNLKRLTTFTLTHNQSVAVDVILPDILLRRLSLRLAPADFRAICVASSETLTELFLDGVAFESEHLVHLNELPHLRELTLQTVADGVSLLHLRELPCFVFLKKLELGDFAFCDLPHSNSEILAHMLSQTKCLEYLSLWGITGAQQHVNCIDWVHKDAPLLEVRLDAPVDVLDFPTMVCSSVTTLYLGFRQTFVDGVARLDSIAAQMQQLPILFPNLNSLDTGLLREPFQQPFNCLERLSLLSTKIISGNALRRCFATNVFPKLRILDLTAEKDTSNISVADVIIWCRDLKKMKYLERFTCRGSNLNFTAKSAEIAREYFPSIDYELSDDEYNREYFFCRDRRIFWDSEENDEVCEDNSNDKNDKKSGSEASVGTRRQREDEQ